MPAQDPWLALLQDPLARQWVQSSMPAWARNAGTTEDQFLGGFLANNPNSIAANQFRNFYRSNSNPQVGAGDLMRPTNPFPEGDPRNATWSPRRPPTRGSTGVPEAPNPEVVRETPSPAPRGGQGRRPGRGQGGGGGVPSGGSNSVPGGMQNQDGGGYQSGPPAAPGIPTNMNGGGYNQPAAPDPTMTNNLPPWAGPLLDWINQVYGGNGEAILNGILRSRTSRTGPGMGRRPRDSGPPDY